MINYIVVFFTTGEVIDFADVNDRRRVWRRVSKACKRWGSRVDKVIEFRGARAADLFKCTVWRGDVFNGQLCN